jgi:hypothetical protein
MTKTEIELLKELGYSPMQIFNLTDEEVKKILANTALDVADHITPNDLTFGTQRGARNQA